MAVFSVLSTGALCGANGPRRLFITSPLTNTAGMFCPRASLCFCCYAVTSLMESRAAYVHVSHPSEQNLDLNPFRDNTGLFLQNVFIEGTEMLVDPPPQKKGQCNFIHLTHSLKVPKSAYSRGQWHWSKINWTGGEHSHSLLCVKERTVASGPDWPSRVPVARQPYSGVRGLADRQLLMKPGWWMEGVCCGKRIANLLPHALHILIYMYRLYVCTPHMHHWTLPPPGTRARCLRVAM